MKFVSIDSNGNEKEVMQQGSNANTDAEIEKGDRHITFTYEICNSNEYIFHPIYGRRSCEATCYNRRTIGHW